MGLTLGNAGRYRDTLAHSSTVAAAGRRPRLCPTLYVYLGLAFVHRLIQIVTDKGICQLMCPK